MKFKLLSLTCFATCLYGSVVFSASSNEIPNVRWGDFLLVTEQAPEKRVFEPSREFPILSKENYDDLGKWCVNALPGYRIAIIDIKPSIPMVAISRINQEGDFVFSLQLEAGKNGLDASLMAKNYMQPSRFMRDVVETSFYISNLSDDKRTHLTVFYVPFDQTLDEALTKSEEEGVNEYGMPLLKVIPKRLASVIFLYRKGAEAPATYLTQEKIEAMLSSK